MTHRSRCVGPRSLSRGRLRQGPYVVPHGACSEPERVRHRRPGPATDDAVGDELVRLLEVPGHLPVTEQCAGPTSVPAAQVTRR